MILGLSVRGLLKRAFWLLLLAFIGFWVGASLVAMGAGVLVHNGQLDNSDIAALRGLLYIVYFAFALAFAWLFAGRRYWKSWKQSKPEAPLG